MSLIKIIANGIELNFVKDTLSIKKENNSLIRDFKVAYSSVPFLIVENENTNIALGTRDLSSVKKKKTVSVYVFEGGNKYLGELQILSYLNVFRKCNLKYASELLSIMDKKISEFMPVVSVIPGETTPVSYTEKADALVEGYENWDEYPLDFIENGFPDVKWQFPTMNWKDKFGVDLSEDDEWHGYGNKINGFKLLDSMFLDGLFENNSFTENETEVLNVFNRNVPSPQIYLISPLFYALDSIGFKPSGDFYTDNFIKRLLLLSTKDNLCEVKNLKDPAEVVFTGSFESYTDPNGNTMYKKDCAIDIPSAGTYTVKYSFTLSGPTPYYSFGVYGLFAWTPGFDDVNQYLFRKQQLNVSSKVFEGTIDFSFDAADTLNLEFQSYINTMPSYSISIIKQFDKTFHQMHPTIELGRYLPEWTFATYLNAIQNMFNLDINIDDFKKEMRIDYNEDKIVSDDKIVLSKSLYIENYDQTPYNAFLLKYQNEEDLSLWITSEGAETFVNQKSSFSDPLDSKFKFIPVTNTAELSEAIDSKEGVGLMIYNHELFPNVSDDYLGQNLNIDGEGGIYKVYWKKWLKFRLNASEVEMSGPFTQTELNKILLVKRIYIDNQEYMISSIQYSERQQDNFDVKFSLLSITF